MTLTLTMNSKTTKISNQARHGTRYGNPVDPRLDWVVGRRGIPYHDWGLHREKLGSGIKSAQVLITKKKWIILESQLATYAYDNTAKFNAMNFNIIRYAQVLLWAAECEVEIGNPEKAKEYVNMIRQRAKDGSYVRLGDEAPLAMVQLPPIIKWISIRIHGQD